MYTGKLYYLNGQTKEYSITYKTSWLKAILKDTETVNRLSKILIDDTAVWVRNRKIESKHNSYLIDEACINVLNSTFNDGANRQYYNVIIEDAHGNSEAFLHLLKEQVEERFLIKI